MSLARALGVWCGRATLSWFQPESPTRQCMRTAHVTGTHTVTSASTRPRHPSGATNMAAHQLTKRSRGRLALCQSLLLIQSMEPMVRCRLSGHRSRMRKLVCSHATLLVSEKEICSEAKRFRGDKIDPSRINSRSTHSMLSLGPQSALAYHA